MQDVLRETICPSVLLVLCFSSVNGAPLALLFKTPQVAALKDKCLVDPLSEHCSL
jgi:hypothetical protein